MQFATGEQARCGNTFADALLERERVGSPDQIDRRRSLSQKARTPAARLRCVSPLGISQAELISIRTDFEAAGDRHRGRVRC